MKIKNKLWVLPIILFIGFIVNSCDGVEDNECPNCKSGHCFTHCVNENCPVHDCNNHNIIACDVCTPKCEQRGWAIDDEIEQCGKYECICGPKVYGYINSIPVYRVKAVSNDQMDGVYIKLEIAYNGMNPMYKLKINSANLSAFHIVDGFDECILGDDGRYFFEIPYNVDSEDMKNTLDICGRFVLPDIALVKNAIIMAEAKAFSDMVIAQQNRKRIMSGTLLV